MMRDSGEDFGNLYESIKPDRASRAFWSLNREMNPANKVSFIRYIDCAGIEQLRRYASEKFGFKPSYATIVTKSASLALKEYPYANRLLLDNFFRKRMVQFHNCDITVAVEKNVEQNEAIVLAETIYGVEEKDMKTMQQEVLAMSNPKTDANDRWTLFYNLLTKLPVFLSKLIIGMPKYSVRLWIKHRGGACFVNSPARYGVDFLVADMLWPLTVSYGWAKDRPSVVEGELCVRKTMPLIIIFDRRIMAGVPAAKFFNRLAEILENADEELKGHCVVGH